ncbi:hypothetical protein CVT24_008589 [Panaeolus cyanescens]|uniref:F-box domain-containing protein n=1 Tax=Panaeolus cyanescens TaxID=181874 RepID=A0A409W4E9_9AGAR|nr:hypothetical protein CVT24_008589 [Panaeolus cyanescens]
MAHKEDELSHEPVFPLEIVHYIIKHLIQQHPDDFRPTLRSMALACRSYLPFCQELLFQEVEFGFYKLQKERNKRLLRTLKSDQHLSKYIKKLVCSIVTYDVYGCTPMYFASIFRSLHKHLFNVHHLDFRAGNWDADADEAPNGEASLLTDEFLNLFGGFEHITTLSFKGHIYISPAIITRFPNIHTLVIKDGSLDISNDASSTIPIEIEKWSQTLQHLKTRGTCHVPIWALTRLANLESIESEPSLYKYGPTFDNDDPELCDQRQRLRCVASFDRLERVHQLDLDLLLVMTLAAQRTRKSKGGGVSAFPALRTLHLTPNAYDLISDGLGQIFHYTPALEEISLDFNFANRVSRAKPNFATLFQCCNKALRSIKITAEFWVEWDTPAGEFEYNNDILRNLCDGLESVRGQNVIEELELVLHWKNADVLVAEGREEPFDDWARLDSVLMEDVEGDFPRLRRVNFSLRFLVFRDICDGHWFWGDFMKERLRRLCSTRKIRFRGVIHRSLPSPGINSVAIIGGETEEWY